MILGKFTWRLGAALGTMLVGSALQAATYDGGVYCIETDIDDEEECEMWQIEEAWATGPDWRDDFVEVEGQKEPAACMTYTSFAFPITLASGEDVDTITLDVKTTLGDRVEAEGEVLSDEEMYEWIEDEGGTPEKYCWKYGRSSVNPSRAWVLVEVDLEGADPDYMDQVYELDLGTAPTINDQDWAGTEFYDPADGELSSKWTISSLAERFGVSLTGTRELTESIGVTVTMTSQGGDTKVLPRVWFLCDPFNSGDDPEALEAIDENAVSEYHRGDASELFDAQGLYLVTREMLGKRKEPVVPAVEPVVPAAPVVPEAVHAATTEAAPVETAAAEYNGFLKDAAGKIAGSVQLKLTKAGKDGTSKVTGTVQLGSKKEKVSGTYKGGVLTAAGFSNVTLDKNGITGTYKTYTIDGTRNVFAAKDAASKDAAKAALAKYKGAYTVAWQEGGVWGGVTVTVANKGKARVVGFLPDGTKVGADGQLMLGDGAACATLVSKNKKTPLAFNLWLTGGAAVVDGLGSDTHAAKAGALASGKSFTCSLLGNPVPVTVAGKKWSVTTDKATALKFTFNAKAGSFKGSFKTGKQKVTVNGVVVNGVGYGSAVIKKGAKAAVTIE